MSLHIITGCMFAGKTSMLLQKVEHELQSGNTDILVVKHKSDSRYNNKNQVTTHTGLSAQCTVLKFLKDTTKLIEYQRANVVFVDEGQFFHDLYEVTKHMLTDKKCVWVAALDTDYTKTQFSNVAMLTTIADSITRLTAKCVGCNKNATLSRRKRCNNTQIVLVGGSELYEPVCTDCF
jgi:thymidine kinase